MIFDMLKSQFATPVQRILGQNQHLRRLCSGFRSGNPNFHEKVTICDACASDLGPNKPVLAREREARLD